MAEERARAEMRRSYSAPLSQVSCPVRVWRHVAAVVLRCIRERGCLEEGRAPACHRACRRCSSPSTRDRNTTYVCTSVYRDFQ